MVNLWKKQNTPPAQTGPTPRPMRIRTNSSVHDIRESTAAPRQSTRSRMLSTVDSPKRRVTSIAMTPIKSSVLVEVLHEYHATPSMESANNMVDVVVEEEPKQKMVRIAQEEPKISNISSTSEPRLSRRSTSKQTIKRPKKRNKVQMFFRRLIKDMFRAHHATSLSAVGSELRYSAVQGMDNPSQEPIVPIGFPSISTGCDNQTCDNIADCITCASDTHLEKRFQPVFDHMLFDSQENIQHDTEFSNIYDRAGTMTVTPLLDSEGQTPKDLNDALTMLLKDGIVSEMGDTSHSETVDTSKAADKPLKLVKSSQQIQPVIAKKTEPEKIMVEAACNTSLNAFQHRSVFQRANEMLEVNNSLVQLKFRSQLHDDSCTQFFALKSELQLEPYLMDMRAQEARKKAPAIPRRDSDPQVEHQAGMMRLSKPSKSESIHVLNLIRSEREIYIKNFNEPLAKPVLALEQEPEVEEEPTHVPSAPKSTTCCIKCHGDHLRYSADLESLDHLPVGTIEKVKDPFDEIATFNIPCPAIDSFDIKVATGEMTADTQLIFCIHALQPTRELVQAGVFSRINMSEIGDLPTYKLKWTFLRYTDSVPFTLDDIHKGTIPIKHARQYPFEISMGTFIYIWRIPMAVELFIRSNSSERLIGKCVCKLGRCLPNLSKSYSTIGKVQNLDLCLCYPELKPKDFGTLQLKYRIIGNQNQFDHCRPPKPQILRIPPLLVDPAPESTVKDKSTFSMKQTTSNMISDAELQAFQDGLNLVLVRNKALRTTQEEISNELRDRTTWMHEELKWRLTLQENAILSGKDPNTVKWRQWKDETTANVRYRPISDEEYFKDGKAHIEIEIVELALMMDSRPLGDDNITHMYVEYTFLTFTGTDMETQTMRKPQDERPVRFRFKRPFEIHVDDPEAKMLADMIRANESIVFTLIAQPIEALKEIRSCWEFGFASLVLFDLLQSRTNTTIQTILIRDTYAKDTVVGTMKIRFTGVLAMRSMALHILTPPSFKIIR